MGDEQEFLGMVDEMIKKLLDHPKQPLGGARRTGAAPRGLFFGPLVRSLVRSGRAPARRVT